MKKIVGVLVLTNLLFAFFIPALTSAQQEMVPESCRLRRDLSRITGRVACGQGAVISLDSEDAICCFYNTVYNIIDWVFVILLTLAVLLALRGAFEIVTSAGSSEKIAAGRNYILYAVIGVVVALVARAIPMFIRTILSLV